MFAPSFASGDPIIVEDTAELDRALEAGRVAFEHAAHADRYQSDPADDTASDPEGGVGDSESSSSFSFQPKARGGSHSPQHVSRPSSAAGMLRDALHGGEFSPRRPRSAQDNHQHVAKQRAQARVASHDMEREKRAAAANARIQQQQQQRPEPASLPQSRPSQRERAGPSATASHPPAARLPDMTGLTSAVETPAKSTRRYRHAKQQSAQGMYLFSTC